MATSTNQELTEIVARCRRVGWKVEVGSSRTAWKYRVTGPDGRRVQMHFTPSDVNWKKTVLRDLNEMGFEEAEKAFLDKQEEERRARIEADRRKNQAKLEKVAAHAKALEKAARPVGLVDVDLAWALGPTQHPDVRAVMMTPHAATAILDANKANRKLRDDQVEFFVTIIDNNEWGWTHQGIAIDTNLLVQDGQHRLAAIIKTGRSLPMFLTIGMPPENFGKVDTGLPRVARDIAFLRGEVNIPILTSTARLLLILERQGNEAGRKRIPKIPITIVDKKIVDSGDALRQAVARASRIRREMVANAAGLAAAIYLITMKLPEGDLRVGKFLDDFESGINLDDKSDPVYALRRYFIRHEGGKAPRAMEAAALVIKAWNLRAANRTRAFLRYQSDELFPDVFLPAPTVIQPELVEQSA